MFDGAGEYHNKERMEWLIARGMEQLELLHDADVPLPGKPINGDAALENTVENLSISAKYANKTNMNLSGTTANLSDSNKYANKTNANLSQSNVNLTHSLCVATNENTSLKAKLEVYESGAPLLQEQAPAVLHQAQDHPNPVTPNQVKKAASRTTRSAAKQPVAA